MEKIIYFYKRWNDIFSSVQGVEFVEGYDASKLSQSSLKGASTLVILDDLMTSIDSKELVDLFIFRRHESLNPVLVTHNLYYSGIKDMRTISLNTSINVCMRNMRDMSSIRTLGSQMFPNQLPYFLASFEIATREKWSYLLIDSSSHQSSAMRLRSQIFPDDKSQIVFLPV